jgi:uncharacterized protein
LNRRIIGLIVLALLIVKVPASAQSEIDASLPYARWMVTENIMSNTAIMLQEAFITEAEALQIAAHAFRDDPTLETLATFQQAWRQTAYAWYRADVIGYDQSALWRNQISKPPLNVEFVEDFIAEYETIDETFITGIGSTSKGLPAIEYLIFDQSGDQQAVLSSLTTGERAEQRMQYAIASADALYIVALDYLEGWMALRESYLSSSIEETSITEQLSRIREMELRDLTNKLIDTLENIVTMKLGEPLGTSSGGDPRPDLVEFTQADFGREVIIAQLEGLKLFFNGDTTEGAGIGYDDLLAQVGADFNGIPLERAINGQIDTLIMLLQTQDAPLEDLIVSNYALINGIYEAARILVRAVKADMTSALAIELVFSDNDGD